MVNLSAVQCFTSSGDVAFNKFVKANEAKPKWSAPHVPPVGMVVRSTINYYVRFGSREHVVAAGSKLRVRRFADEFGWVYAVAHVEGMPENWEVYVAGCDLDLHTRALLAGDLAGDV